MPASCLCVSANSLILSLHNSSVSSVCQPSALVSRFSLNPHCFGKQSQHGDRGNTSAITPPSLVLTETTDIIGTHILDETTHTHTHANTINKFPSHSYTSKHTHIRLNPPPLVQPPSSFFLSFSSQHQSTQVHSLWWCYPHWCHKKYLFFSYPLSSPPPVYLLCSSLQSAPGIPNSRLSSQSRQTAFNSPDHNAVTTATQVLLAEAAVALFGLWGELGKRREMKCWRERRRGSEEVKVCRTHFSSPVFISGLPLSDC